MVVNLIRVKRCTIKIKKNRNCVGDVNAFPQMDNLWIEVEGKLRVATNCGSQMGLLSGPTAKIIIIINTVLGAEGMASDCYWFGSIIMANIL